MKWNDVKGETKTTQNKRTQSFLFFFLFLQIKCQTQLRHLWQKLLKRRGGPPEREMIRRNQVGGEMTSGRLTSGVFYDAPTAKTQRHNNNNNNKNSREKLRIERLWTYR